MSRRTVLLIVLVVAVLTGFGGWIVGRQIESPAETAARVAPPRASLIAVPVESRELSSAVITRGAIDFKQVNSIEVEQEAGDSVITGLIAVQGDELNRGDVIIEITGRPVFLLEGTLPMFRTFTPGLSGPDVVQFEEELIRLGLDPGPVDGDYDSRTSEAVDEMYRLSGYESPNPTDEERDLHKASLERVELAERTLRTIEKSDSSIRSTESDRLFLNRQVMEAEQAYDALVSERNLEMDQLATARDAVVDVGQATELFELAFSDWRDEVGAASTAVEMARKARVDWLLQAAVRQTNDERSILLKEIGRSYQDERVLEDKLATKMLASELAFLEALPRTVQTLHFALGESPDGPLMNVSDSSVGVVATVSASDRDLLELGLDGILDDVSLGLELGAKIDFIADEPGTVDGASDLYEVRLVPTEFVPDEMLNQNLRLTIPISSSGGDVLAVPLAALSANADGVTRVEKVIEGSETEIIEVSLGLTAGGFVEIRPVEAGSLTTNDRVVVGRDRTGIGQTGMPDTEGG